MIESWRKVWREGFVPSLSLTALKALREAVARDDPRLIQGGTTVPPPLHSVQDWPVEAACAIGLCGVIEFGGFVEQPQPCTVAEAEEYFAQACFDADKRLGGEPAWCRYFLNFWDETPRPELFRLMLPEIELAIAKKEQQCPATPEDLVA